MSNHEVRTGDPRGTYDERLRARRAEAERLGRRDRVLSWARLGTFAAFGGLAWAALGPRWLPGAWLVAPAAAFVGLVAWHARALAARRRVERAAAFYQRGLERLDERWQGKGVAGERFDDAAHPYARDIDLFGKGSLFERLCTTRTQAGEDTLAAWLKAPATADEVRARQAAVLELAPRLDLREQLALDGADVRAEVDPQALSAWATAPLAPASPALRLGLFLLGAATAALVVLWLVGVTGWAPVAAAALVEYLATRPLAKRVETIALGVDRTADELSVLAIVLARLERETFHSPRLQALKARFTGEGGDRQPASRRIAELAQLAHYLQARRNQFFAPFAYLLVWGPQLAFAIERWRARSGKRIPDWLAALGELEALSSLAGYAFERPADPMPEVLDGGEPTLDGHELGHPLLADASCVRNDLALGGALRLLLVSGSNMSGKSTLLRTVGSNVVLALAGAPVRARSLRLTPLQLGATLRIQDSLAEGASRFYAEITRLRQLVDLAGRTPPLFFLLDEILSGTNSHDRRLGAEAVVKGLLERGAIGLCTTHDLALTEMAEALGERARNVHFEDTLEAGELRFDYRMRPGVVRKSNALALMRAVGLHV